MEKETTINTKFINSLLKKDERLSKIEQRAKKMGIPILGQESSAFLKQIVLLKKPKQVLELGMGIGYSGHIILLNSKAHLTSVELIEKRVELAKDFFEKSDLSDRVTLLNGNEVDIVPSLTTKFDLIFMDGAKTRYKAHLPFLKNLLNKNGVLVADNVLFGGAVSGQNPFPKNKTTIVDGLKDFLTTLTNDDDFSTSIVQVGDGMTISIRN
ncbi:MAG: O-methyltransferase [Firmicutes bacterium]|nr:O-methyltransferase [Bacillota bacterium]